MSLSASNAVWAARAAIIDAVAATPNTCSWERAYLVALYLANRHRDVRGYVDDAVGQVSDAVGFDAARALSVLNQAGVWVVVKRGSRRSASWRGPGPLLVGFGGEPYDEEGARQGPRAPHGTHVAQSTHVPGGTHVDEPRTHVDRARTHVAQLSASTPVPPFVSTSGFQAQDDALPPPLTAADEKSIETRRRKREPTRPGADPMAIGDVFNGDIRAIVNAARDAERARMTRAQRDAADWAEAYEATGYNPHATNGDDT